MRFAVTGPWCFSNVYILGKYIYIYLYINIYIYIIYTYLKVIRIVQYKKALKVPVVN